MSLLLTVACTGDGTSTTRVEPATEDAPTGPACPSGSTWGVYGRFSNEQVEFLYCLDDAGQPVAGPASRRTTRDQATFAEGEVALNDVGLPISTGTWTFYDPDNLLRILLRGRLEDRTPIGDWTWGGMPGVHFEADGSPRVEGRIEDLRRVRQLLQPDTLIGDLYPEYGEEFRAAKDEFARRRVETERRPVFEARRDQEREEYVGRQVVVRARGKVGKYDFAKSAWPFTPTSATHRPMSKGSSTDAMVLGFSDVVVKETTGAFKLTREPAGRPGLHRAAVVAMLGATEAAAEKQQECFRSVNAVEVLVRLSGNMGSVYDTMRERSVELPEAHYISHRFCRPGDADASVCTPWQQHWMINPTANMLAGRSICDPRATANTESQPPAGSK